MTAAPKPQPIYRKDYKAPDFLIESTLLLFEIFDGYTDVTAQTTFTRNGNHTNALSLDGEELELLSINLDGNALAETEYALTDKKLELTPEGDRFRLEIKTRIKPEENTALEGLYKSSVIYCTQCEAEGFRRITYFLDRPDVLTKFHVRIEADKKSCPVLLSNGNPVGKGDMDGGRHYAEWEDPFPKPSYLFALVAGKLGYRQDSFTTMSGKVVDLRIYVEEKDIPYTDHAMMCLKQCMAWDEERFGREYDLNLFNIVAVHDFNMGAMENKSLNIFNTQLIYASPELYEDKDFFNVDRVVAHEYFHNWSGNRVNCRDWFQLSLKEGFTVFREQEYMADFYGRDSQRISDVKLLWERQFPEDSGPMAHPVRPDSYIAIDNFYTMTIYEKGAEVIRMIHTLIGEERFRAGSDLYFERFDGQAVTCDDFVDCMEEASDFDLSQFRLWYDQAGTPQVTVEGQYDAVHKTYRFTLHQSIPDTPGQKDKKPQHIPVQVGLLNKETGADMIGTQTLYLRDPEQVFEFESVSVEPVTSTLRNFSAPVTLEQDLSADDLSFLMMKDSDGFNRWQAGQTLMTQRLKAIINEQHAIPDSFGEITVGFEALIDGFRENYYDPSLLVKSLTLPSHTNMIQALGKGADPHKTALTLKQVKCYLADTLKDQWLRLYNEFQDIGTYSADHESIARRELKNMALSYLMAAETPDLDLARAQYNGADNMTDRMAALREIVHHKGDLRDSLLAEFYATHKEHPLVVNKWLVAQAISEADDTVEIVKALQSHEAFSIKNPNKVRALIGAFAQLNMLHFHTHAGYGVLRDAVITLNKINPQIAARMVAPLLQWRNIDAGYAAKMKACLEDIAREENLSDMVYEVVSKGLAD
tara:strand:+ start:2616 stop:5225 length:2610 start_codon:yes stop_codon:yes gene_type:complete